VTALAFAIDHKRWELASLYLLLGVSRAAAALPPDTIDGLLEVLEAAPGERRHGQERRGARRGTGR